MPAYKDNRKGTWYCKFYYTDWTGTRRQKMKRGFKLQREAKEYERLFLEQFAKDPDITFESLYGKYKGYIKPRIRETTYKTRTMMADIHILPFFKSRIVSDISPADVAAWQEGMLSKGLSSSYLHTVNGVLDMIFNYAVEYVGLRKSPCRNPIGSTKRRDVTFWTLEEYRQFSAACSVDIMFFTVFEVLYYTGMREGEFLALTLNDIDFKNCKITINKTYCRMDGKDIINPPKTPNSNRVIDIPGFLADEIKEYVSRLYRPDPETQLFTISARTIRRALNRYADEAGVKRIRVHDIRHSHASLLIDLGANPVLVAERLGHESADITLRIYSHLFPTRQEDVVQKIADIRK